jgi:ribonuclease P protein component
VPACLIEAKRRPIKPHASTSAEVSRFGFTVTKKIGNAVTRNRIRRRLKAALAELAPALAQPGFDYVVVARPVAFSRPYADIIGDLTRAFAIIHGGKPSKPKNTAGKAQP